MPHLACCGRPILRRRGLRPAYAARRSATARRRPGRAGSAAGVDRTALRGLPGRVQARRLGRLAVLGGVVVRERVLELAGALAERAAELGEPLGAEDEQEDDGE